MAKYKIWGSDAEYGGEDKARYLGVYEIPSNTHVTSFIEYHFNTNADNFYWELAEKKKKIIKKSTVKKMAYKKRKTTKKRKVKARNPLSKRDYMKLSKAGKLRMRKIKKYVNSKRKK